MLSINPPPSHQRKGKGGKGRETYKLNIKSFTNNTNNTNNTNSKSNKTKYTKPILSFPELGAGVLASCQQLPGSTRKSQTSLGSRQELDSGMHRQESASGS